MRHPTEGQESPEPLGKTTLPHPVFNACGFKIINNFVKNLTVKNEPFRTECDGQFANVQRSIFATTDVSSVYFQTCYFLNALHSQIFHKGSSVGSTHFFQGTKMGMESNCNKAFIFNLETFPRWFMIEICLFVPSVKSQNGQKMVQNST